MRCPQCGAFNEEKSIECKDCAVVFSDLRRAAGKAHASAAHKPSDMSGIPELPVGYRSGNAHRWDEWRKRWQDEKRSLAASDAHLRPLCVWMEGETYGAFIKRVREHVAKQ